MLTTGSKFFFAGTLLALVAMVAYGVGTEWHEYFGWVLLGSLALISAFLGFVVLAFRDANLDAPAIEALSAADAEGRTAVGHRGVPPSAWPVVGAFGAGLLAIGLVLDWRLFLLGLVALLAAAVEWMVQGYADRASADPEYNARLRARIMHPIEFPFVGVLGGGLLVFGFSRVMLALDKNGSVFTFIALGALILIVATLLSFRPKLSGNLAVGLLVLGGVAVLAAGVIGIGAGERSFAHGESETEKNTNQVGDKSNPLATVVSAGGTLTPETVALPRSLTVNVIFENDNESGKQALVIVGPPTTEKDAAGNEVTKPQQWQTVPIEKGKRGLVTFKISIPGTYEMHTEGEGPEAKGQLVVP